MRICKACSKENPDYIKSCLDCGKNVEPTSNKFRVKIFAAGLIIIAATVAVVAVKKTALLLSGKNTPEKSVEPEASAIPVSPPEQPSPKMVKKISVQPIPDKVQPMQPAVVQSNEHGSSIPSIVAETSSSPGEEPKKAGPKPRKRLEHEAVDTADILAGTNPSSIKINGPAGASHSGIKSASEGYMRTLHHAIVKEYLESLANHGMTDKDGERSKVTVLVNSRTSEIELLKMSDNLDSQKKDLVRKVISDCSGRILCPKELNDDMGELVKLDFPLAINP